MIIVYLSSTLKSVTVLETATDSVKRQQKKVQVSKNVRMTRIQLCAQYARIQRVLVTQKDLTPGQPLTFATITKRDYPCVVCLAMEERIVQGSITSGCPICSKTWVGIQWRADDVLFDFEICPNYQKLP